MAEGTTPMGLRLDQSANISAPGSRPITGHMASGLGPRASGSGQRLALGPGQGPGKVDRLFARGPRPKGLAIWGGSEVPGRFWTSLARSPEGEAAAGLHHGSFYPSRTWNWLEPWTQADSIRLKAVPGWCPGWTSLWAPGTNGGRHA